MALPHEEKPLGLQIPSVPQGVEIPPEPPDVGARGLSIASRLLAGATTFFFLAFVFAYFYLRSIDSSAAWRGPKAHVDQGLGVAFAVCTLLSALLAIAAGRGMKSERRNWLGLAAGSLGLGLAAIALQCIEYLHQGFGPTRGAFASVFCSWTALYLIAALCTMYWLETQVATELRARRVPAGSGDIKDPDRLIAPALDACVFYWSYLAAIGLLMYVVLYLL